MAALIRKPLLHELSIVRDVVCTVVRETYRDLVATVDEEDWSLAWVAVVGQRIVGMTLTDHDWLSDLWVLREQQGRGVGSQLLAQAEAEIFACGYLTAQLRVVKSNLTAVNFYRRNGWQVSHEFPHEKLPVTMLVMTKSASGG